MGLGLVLGSLGLLALPAFARRWGRLVCPAEWSRVCGTSLALGASMFELAVVLYAIPAVAGVVGASDVAAMCRRVLEPFDPAIGPVGAAAAVLAVAIPASGLVALVQADRTAHRAYVEHWRGEHRPRAGYELVTLDSPVPVAVAVPARVPQVVVTRAIVDQLSAAQLAAVVRHELAHLQHGHDRSLAVASALEHAFPFVPVVRAGTAAWRAGMERWADETAAGSSLERRDSLREALIGVTWMLTDTRLAAFSSADCLLERLDALSAPPQTPSRLAGSCLRIPLVAAIVLVALAIGLCMGITS